MTLDALVIFSGAVVAILPFLGFPSSWDHAIFFILGLFVIALGIAVRRRLNQKAYTPNSTSGHTIPFDEQPSENR